MNIEKNASKYDEILSNLYQEAVFTVDSILDESISKSQKEELINYLSLEEEFKNRKTKWKWKPN